MNVSTAASVASNVVDEFTSVNSPEKFNLVGRAAARLFGDRFASSLKADMMNTKNTQCKILYVDKCPRGIAVFDSSITHRNSSRCLENALRIRELILVDEGKESPYAIYQKLIQKVVEEAKLLEAAAVYTYTEGDRSKRNVFLDNGFRFMRDSDILIKDIETPIRRKRGFSEREDNIDQASKRVRTQPPVASVIVKKHHEATLKNPYVGQIRSGVKTIEGRINSGMFRPVKAGDTIRFFNQSGDVKCSITQVSRYSSFREMLEKEGYKSCLPTARSLEDAVREYDKIPGYSNRAKQYGVLALHLENMKA